MREMSLRFVPSSVGVLVLVTLSSTLVGCGATGLAWVDEPEPTTGWTGLETQRAAVQRAAPAEPIPASVDAEGGVENHQRLNRTITLGEVEASSSVPEGAPPAYGAPSVSVTINNYGQSGYAPSGYYTYGAFAARGSRSASFGQSQVTGASRPGSSGVQAGQNWPSIADHGSSFPYRSAPASPWSAAGTRQ